MHLVSHMVGQALPSADSQWGGERDMMWKRNAKMGMLGFELKTGESGDLGQESRAGT